MKNISIISTAIILLCLCQNNLLAQDDVMLKQKAKTEEVEQVNKPTIQTNENDLDAQEKVELEEARQRAKAKNVKMSDEFKKKKVGIDKNREKLYAKKAAYKEKLDSKKWSREKYNKKMAKLDTKEDKIQEKKTKLLESMMSK
jgi:hypothetical protein